MHRHTVRWFLRAALCAAFAPALLASLSACANPQATGGALGSTVAASASSDCKTMQGQLANMKSKGQGNSPAYRQLLDRYLGRCFG